MHTYGFMNARRATVLVAVAIALGAVACTPPIEPGPICLDSVSTVQTGAPEAVPATGWWTDDTRSNGSVAVNADLGAPVGLGCRSAKLTTGEATGSPLQDKAQLFSFELAGTPLSSIDTISYWANKSAASTGGSAINLALNVSVTGSSVPTGFATLVYEPYQQSGGQAAIQVGVWQQWDATATTPGDGEWWTSKIPSGPGSQGQPMPWAQFQALFSDANIMGYGFNLGSNNPNTTVAGDGLVFGSAFTDF